MTWTRGLIVAAVLLVLAVVVVLTLPIPLTPYVRNRITQALGERFDAKVELSALRVSVLPTIRVAGEGVVLRHKGRTDVPPLIQIKSFSADANLWGLLGKPFRLRNVTLQELQINIPPGGMKLHKDDAAKDDKSPEPGKVPAGDAKADAAASASAASKRAASTPSAAKPSAAPGPPPSAATPPPAPDRQGRPKKAPLIVGEVITENAMLRIIPRDPEKQPREFAIHHLTMNDVGAEVPWRFRATLTNPKPPGEIETEGTFGPWSAGEPALTPLEGKYTFRKADLGVFKGIGGLLDSDGAFGGVLERIEVNGRTTTPDFVVTVGGHPVPLTTQFHSVVDGTNGNTWLDPVNAKLQETPILAKGGVIGQKGVKGRTVSLDVVIDKGRIEDILRLAVKGKTPIMTGVLNLKTAFLLPPGEDDAIDKLQLDGEFSIAQAHFTNFSVQEKIAGMSRRARGLKGDPSRAAANRIVSDLRGRFVLKRGVLHFSSLTFGMPGASVRLAGTYSLRHEQINFQGTVLIDATISQMTSGFKSVLLKAVDPLFRRKGKGTVLPIKISGSREDPKFGVDVKRVLTRK